MTYTAARQRLDIPARLCPVSAIHPAATPPGGLRTIRGVHLAVLTDAADASEQARWVQYRAHMSDYTDTTQIQERLREKAQQRLSIIPNLADAAAARERALAAVVDADNAYRDVYDEAIRLGWTESELKGAGLSPRPTGGRKRPTAKRATTRQHATESESQNPPTEHA